MNILILMSHTGGGHRSVSLALKEAIERNDPSAAVSIVDAFDLERASLIDRTTKLYGPAIRHVPSVYGWAFHFTHRPRVFEHVVHRASRPLVPKLRRLLLGERPDVIVSTHPLCNRALAIARASLPSIPLMAVVTELVTVHRSWMEPEIDHYTTATREALEAILSFGVRPESVSQLGLPIGSRFGAVLESPAELRGSLGLDTARTTVLIVGGGEGSGELHRLVLQVIKRALAIQLIVVCGRNRRLQTQLSSLETEMPMAVLGFVETMPELMHAADVIMTKGGPQTVLEGITSGRPLIVTQTLPGQEEGNAQFVERHAIGFDGRRLAGALDALERLVGDPDLRQTMGTRARALAQPHAADQIAQKVLELGRAGEATTGLQAAGQRPGDG